MTREPINVAASVIADVSAGIYRSPAGALKELVSNAFDADATHVQISTGWPRFKTFTCTDDGRGILPEHFKSLMQHIGGSTKRDESQVSERFGRPLIGRIGIGLLSIAQICRKFSVISSVAGDRRKLRADVDLAPYMTAEARRKHLGETVAAAGSQDEKGQQIRIGEYALQEADEEPDKHYTRIVMTQIDEGFRKRLVDRANARGGFSIRTFTQGNMDEFVNLVERGDSVAAHGAYAQLVWELAVASPVQYLDDGPFKSPGPIVDGLRKRLDSYHFQVSIDGVELRKPIKLPDATHRGARHQVYEIAPHAESLSDGRRLDVTGYLYWQQGQILPRELQGVLVRVRNVAIGVYDPSFLGYPLAEGWKFSQISGELNVDEGLDPAINIDRASFRESDEAYVETQGFLFETLKKGREPDNEGVFPSIKREASSRRRKKQLDDEKRRKKLAGRLVTGHSHLLEVTEEYGEAIGSGVKVDGDGLSIEVDLLRAVPRRHRMVFSVICALIEKEAATSLSRERRRRLYEQIASLLKEY
jgi:histidine kinase/DNA gyrase B/HSP90-like ATPase